MPNLLDHAFFILLAAALPLWAAFFSARRLRRALLQDQPRVRLSTYRRALIVQWTLTIMLLAVWIAQDRSLSWLGLIPRPTPGLIGVAVGMAIVGFIMVRQRNATLADDEALEQVRGKLGKLESLLPHTRQELAWFCALSITAGICEEILYRGFMLWYLGHGFHWINAMLVGAAVFGLGHSYQGWRGVLVTAAAGLFFGLVYWVTGSLLAPMVIHALMDLHSGHLAYVAFGRAPRPWHSTLATTSDVAPAAGAPAADAPTPVPDAPGSEAAG